MKPFVARAAAVAALTCLVPMLAAAKLAPPSDEAKAKAAEAAAKSAWTAKVEGYKLCQSQDRVAAAYHAAARKAGKAASAGAEAPPCADPGAFVAASTEAKPPIEAAGAHSPTKTAAGPPSTTTPAAEIPAKK